MNNTVKGIHHITAIAGDAKRNFKFYTQTLGQRFVKKTVNFDDPHTYHFYYGDEQGTPGSILTFFPWGNAVKQGRRGAGLTTEFGYSIPEDSLDFWLNRLQEKNVIHNKTAEKFGEKYITLLDPDGLKMELTVTGQPDNRKPFVTPEIGADVATRGFHHVTLTLNDIKPTEEVITSLLGYKLIGNEVNRYRYINENIDTANVIDLVLLPKEERAINANGTIHHVAFRVSDDAAQMELRKKIVDAGFHITPQIDRNYFHSLYFREPGGVLFEIATDNPGFTVDEPLAELGTNLKLPAQYETQRSQIEKHLVKLED